ncbi:MAG: thiosulfate/3-mercaptopyruvate sulfurtransferase [Actinomycetota bacterium]|nr:thiosulfate/3-mercaptopyruvate sulfurtransferase [Actinomycetota bacterium]
MPEYANKDVLVETDWLEQHADDSDVAIVEVDEDFSAYEKGHIQNAIAINWATELTKLPSRDFISREDLAKLLGERGISSDQTIVLYGANNNWFATYAYWLFKYRGVDNVKVLNGGRKKWELESRILTQDLPQRPKATFDIGAEHPEYRIYRDDVIQRATKGGEEWVDVRSPEEYRGELLAPPHLPQEQAQVPGHIPGASNITWSKAAQEDGTFKPAEELIELYKEEGITGEKEIVTYCRIGERSSHSWFVLKELLGYGDVKNYDGSWTEYGSLVGVPIEK